MSISSEGPAAYTQLRDKAEAQLEAGTTPATTYWAMGVDALRMLHRLSSNPATAADALKLLHELQVHQVELDLQNEEIAANERALRENLSRYRALYDGAPVGYFVVTRDGAIVEGNLAAEQLFGVARDNLAGRHIATLLPPEFQSLLHDMLQPLKKGGRRASCAVPGKPDASGANTTLQFHASVMPGSGHILLTCAENTRVGKSD